MPVLVPVPVPVLVLVLALAQTLPTMLVLALLEMMRNISRCPECRARLR